MSTPLRRGISSAAAAVKPASWKNFELKMWNEYSLVAPQATKIHQLFEQQGEKLINDHVAFRTFNHNKVDLNVIGDNLHRHYNYKPIQEYDIPEKNLTAKHFEHADDPLSHPLIFVSEFDLDSLNHYNQDTIYEAMDSMHRDYDPAEDDKFLVSKRLWNPISIEEYESLWTESQYASWVAVFGYIPNHFTVCVNYLTKYTTVKSVNAFLENHGFKLNESGGKIKGDDDIGLMQSSTMAPLVEAEFRDGMKMIPGAYYEFAHRFVIGEGKSAGLFRGFVAGNANKIFESTNIKM